MSKTIGSSESSYSRKKEYSSSKQKKKAGIVILALFILLILPITLIISQSLRLVHLNYQLEVLENNLSELQTENRELILNLSSKTSLERIERVARQELGMVEAENVTRLALKEVPSENEILYASNNESNWLSSFWHGIQNVRAATLE
ncbi:MAG: cell division protein FtsL [Halarsenatibacteraceae bacterium]